MIPDTFVEYVSWLAIKSIVKNSVFHKFCDQRQLLLLSKQNATKSCNETSSLMARNM